MYIFRSLAVLAALSSSAFAARQAGQIDLANRYSAMMQPQRIIPPGKKRHADRPKKRPNRQTISARVRRKHRRAA